MKTEKEIKDFFEKVEAIQNGHFILSSGKDNRNSLRGRYCKFCE